VENRYDDVIRLSDTLPQLAADIIQAAADTVADDGRFIDLAADDHRDPVGLPPGVISGLDREVRPARYLPVPVGMTQAVIAVKTMSARNHINRV